MTKPASPQVLRSLLLAVALVLLCVVVFPFQDVMDYFSADPAVRLKRNIEFAHFSDNTLKMDIARPARGKGPFPVLVFIPGGGWQYDGNAFHEEILRAAKRGFVAARVCYRLMDKQKDGRAKHPFPAQIEDVKTAIAWLREHASEYRLDPQRIGLVGMSAGGQLALLAGLDAPQEGPPRVRAVVNFYGPTDLLEAYEKYPNGRPLLKTLLDGTPDEVRERYKAASPVYYVSKNSPPVLTIHGREDQIVPLEQSELLDAQMKKIGAHHRLVVFDGEYHGFSADGLRRANDLMYRFLQEHLGPLSTAQAGLDGTATARKSSSMAN